MSHLDIASEKRSTMRELSERDTIEVAGGGGAAPSPPPPPPPPPPPWRIITSGGSGNPP